jgi:hypothetical protein
LGDPDNGIQVGQKGFNILSRTVAQALPGQKVNKGLRPFDIKERSARRHLVILRTGPKSAPKFFSRCGLAWTFFIHKYEPIQMVNSQDALP